MTCNADLLATARANIIERNNYAHRNAILAGRWDAHGLVQAEIASLLRAPPLAEGEPA